MFDKNLLFDGKSIGNGKDTVKEKNRAKAQATMESRGYPWK
jgi:hypothetical protein